MKIKSEIEELNAKFDHLQYRFDNKIVNLGGKTYPFNKFINHLKNNQLIEYFKDFI